MINVLGYDLDLYFVLLLIGFLFLLTLSQPHFCQPQYYKYLTIIALIELLLFLILVADWLDITSPNPSIFPIQNVELVVMGIGVIVWKFGPSVSSAVTLTMNCTPHPGVGYPSKFHLASTQYLSPFGNTQGEIPISLQPPKEPSKRELAAANHYLVNLFLSNKTYPLFRKLQRDYRLIVPRDVDCSNLPRLLREVYVDLLEVADEATTSIKEDRIMVEMTHFSTFSKCICIPQWQADSGAVRMCPTMGVSMYIYMEMVQQHTIMESIQVLPGTKNIRIVFSQTPVEKEIATR